MAEGVRLLLAFGLAGTLTVITVPAAIRVARRTSFFDTPTGYKAHRQATPYLGGAAVIAATAVSTIAFAADWDRYWPLLLGTLAFLAVGTMDDRVGLSPWLRLGVEAVAAWFLWHRGIGWAFFDSDAANLTLTVLWVAGIVNGFNLMDNLDGAASSVALVSAACVGALAVIGDDLALAVPAACLCGALVGFLRYNLQRPARIFLGDGGSMAIGFFLAGALMVVPMGEISGLSTLIVATLAVGLPVFDTALVVLSRTRRGAPVLSGATDHTTHRLNAILRSPRRVACALAAVQAGLCLIAIEATQLGSGAAIAGACFALLLGVAAIAAVEGAGWTAVSDDS